MMTHLLKNIFNIALCGLLSASLAGCEQGGDEANKTTAAPTAANADFIELSQGQLATLNIQFDRLGNKQIVERIYLNGKVKALPNLSATISSNTQGKVSKVWVIEGSKVRKGQALVTLASMQLIELQNEYLSAKSEADFATIELKRQEELVRSNVGALAELQTAEAKYKAALSRQKTLLAKLDLLGISPQSLQDAKTALISEYITINSPIDGYVVKLPIAIGMLATDETTLAELVNTDDLQAEIYVYDKDINLIQEGQSVDVDFINQAYPTVQGKVMSISRSIDTETKGIEVHISFKAPQGALVLPGMSVRAIVLSKDKSVNAHTVPLAAIFQEEDQYYVFGSENAPQSEKMRIKKYKVNLGDRDEAFTEVIFPNEIPANFMIAQSNVAALEMQRKQAQGSGM